MQLNFRVGKTSGAAHVAREFGYSPAQFGNLTPEQVHDAARTAKVLELQKQLAQAMVRHLEKIYKNKVEIERLTLEAIEKGLTAKAEIDKYVQQAVIAGAKHDAHIQKLEHQLQQELNLVKGQLLSDKALATQSFQQRLLLIRANHQARGQVQTHGFQQRLKEIQASPQQAIAMQNKRQALNAYINAKDFDPIPALPGNSGNNNSPIAQNQKGFLGGLFDFFTGKK
jgi:hypothetical protein